MQTHVSQAPGAAMPSDPVIPAVPGEFYSYSSEFSLERPLGFLLKCKSNKARPMTDAGLYPEELDLTFVFGNAVWVCSPNAAPSIRLLGDVVIGEALNQTRIAPANITEDAFYELRQQKDGSALAQVCRVSASQNYGVMVLSPGTMIAVETESGKYGLLLVKELAPSSVKIDACHILL